MQENMIEQNIIISEPCRNLRALGRNALKDKWKTAIIAVLVYIIVVQFPQLVFDSLLGTNIASLLQPDTYYNLYPYIDIEMYNDMPKMSFLSPIYILLVTGALELGVSIFFLATFRRHDVNVSDVFLGFERFGKALGLFLFRALFTFLWTCLFFVPGIIASIRYSQAFFILADNPDKGIRQCMNESKAMMKGNKAKYFILALSFIGWILLSAIPAGIIEGMGSIVSDNQFVISLFSLIGALCMAPVTAYMYSTFAGFYEILAGHLIKETKPIPVTVEEAKKQYEEMQAKPSAEAETEAAEAEAETETAEEEEKKKWRKKMSSDFKMPETENFKFMCNRDCEFFPCHESADPENFNCLFCYCPLYALGRECGGNFTYTENGIKDCSSCMIPHSRNAYSHITEKSKLLVELAKEK